MANKPQPRTLLNNVLQSMYHGNYASHVRWETWQTVSNPMSSTWHATIYINDLMYGTASGTTKGAAQDQAALQAYNALTRESFRNVASDKVVEGRSPPSNVILTSGNRPILEPKGGLASFHPHDKLFIDLHPVQDLGPAVDGSDVSLDSLKKYMEGNSFDLRGIGEFLSFPGLHPNLQCAALQLLEHAAEWQSTNFTECISVTFGPVANLVLDSREIQVRCAALDTLRLFLESPRATDIVKSMIPRGVVDAVSKDLDFPEPHVQLASVELLEVAAQSEEILIEFATAASHISSALPSMPIATQVTALRALETGVRANIHEFFKALADELHHLKKPLSSPDATIQIATLKVLEDSAQSKDPDLFRAVQTLLPDVKYILLFGKTDLHSAASRVMEALGVGGYSDRQASWSVGQESDRNV